MPRFSERAFLTFQSLGLLILRLGAGGLLAIGHGWGKVGMLFSDASKFADPIGLGPTVTLILAVLAEFVCALLVAFGLVTRLAAIPVVATMAVAAFVAHAADPWFMGPGVERSKELALLYLTPFLTLVFTGPGAYSLDALIWSRWKRRTPKT